MCVCVPAVCMLGIIMVRDSCIPCQMWVVPCVLLLHEIHVKILLHSVCSVEITFKSYESVESVDDHLDSLALLKCVLQLVSSDLAQCAQVKSVAVNVVF